MSIINFQNYIYGLRSRETDKRAFYSVVSTRRIRVRAEGRLLMLPYLVDRMCWDLTSYCTAWVGLHGYAYEFKEVFASPGSFMEAMNKCYRTQNYMRYEGYIPPDCSPPLEEVMEVENRCSFYVERLWDEHFRCIAEGKTYSAPFMVAGYVRNFEDYWDKWIEQRGMWYDLKKNGVHSSEVLEQIVWNGFEKYVDLVAPYTETSLKGEFSFFFCYLLVFV